MQIITTLFENPNTLARFHGADRFLLLVRVLTELKRSLQFPSKGKPRKEGLPVGVIKGA